MEEELSKRIQDLPPELFNQIQDEVLSYEPPAPNANGYHFIDVTRMYRFPNFLQIDRSTRESLSIDYYSQKVFRFSCAEDFVGFITAMCDRHFALTAGFQAWIPRRSRQHVRLLTMFQKQMDVRAAVCDRVMLGHFEAAHQAEEGDNSVHPAGQEVYVVWNEPVDEVK